ncbi:hypothetical protein ABNQ39_20680 [Azospirillum sp. A26]|uniref:hypothetical protein n=1 Tax=Azospirillum sp. A26 TaxID=3160607 RepID=UPI0036705E1C
MADCDPMDPTSYSTQPPAAPLSADELAEMRARWARVVADVPVGAMDNSERGERLGHLIGSDMYRLLSALEAEQANTKRAESMLRRVWSIVAPDERPDFYDIDMKVRDALEALTAENARLNAELREERAQHLADLGQLQQPECYVTGDEYDDVTSRTLRNLSNPEFMAAAFGEIDGAKEER